MATPVEFVKMHGLGNDFIIVDCVSHSYRERRGTMTMQERDRARVGERLDALFAEADRERERQGDSTVQALMARLREIDVEREQLHNALFAETKKEEFGSRNVLVSPEQAQAAISRLKARMPRPNDNYVEQLAAAAPRLCDRHFGIGSDGLILVMPDLEYDFHMRIINSDGSEAEMCGNGIRCFARYVYEHGLIEKTVFTVKTLAGPITPELVIQDGRIAGVRVDMGEPRLERSLIPMEGPAGRVIEEPLAVADSVFAVTAVSMGNPHAVIFVKDVDNFPVEHYGPKIETHPAFPRKTNVEFVEVTSPTYLRMRVWERGAGITLACGTGACATLVAAVLTGNSERRATVVLPGGPLDIEWREADNRVYMTGPAEEVFTGAVEV